MTRALGALLAAAAVWLAGSSASERTDGSGLRMSHALGRIARDFPARVRADPGRARVAFVGDSTLMAADGMTNPERQALPGRVQQGLKRQGGYGDRVTLHTLIAPGLCPVGFYIASEPVIAARPERAVFSLNLRCFARGAMRDYPYTESAGFMPSEQVLEALTLPMFYFGLTADRLLYYRTLVALGAADAWHAVRRKQARFLKLREHYANELEDVLGLKGNRDMQFALGIARLQRSRDGERDRQSYEFAQQTVTAFTRGLSPAHPNLRVLDAALRRFQRAGIPVLVYLEPINLDHLRALGIELSGFDESLRVIERVLRGAGAEVADFHALLPDAAFRDASDHYTFRGDPDGTNWLGDRIAYAIVKTAPEAQHAVQ